MKYFSVDYFRKIQEIVMQYTLNNYDYCYLSAMHTKNHRLGAKTIIAGSSHAMNGIVESGLDEEVINFSISSQDLYFDFEHIKKAVEEGKQRIDTCIINIGYYMLYQDLSYSKVMSYLIPKVYYPLLNKSHHYEIVDKFDPLKSVEFDRNMFAEKWVRRFADDWAIGFFMEESTYYGSLRTRENNNILGLKKVIWNQLSADEKRSIAIQRTNDHNRLILHEHSRRENGELVKEMAEYLFQHDITPLVVIFPFTSYYNNYINREYKADIISLLDELPWPIEFLDMNDYSDIFDDTDFLDTDHLNLQGALKATELLNDYIKLIKNER